MVLSALSCLRAASGLLVLALGVSVALVSSEYAYSVDPACGPLNGAGEHEVSTVAQLKAVGSGGTGNGECGLQAKYRQMAHIDVSEESSWTPIGPNAGSSFNGSYHGNGFVIRGGATWNGSGFVGLFGYLGSTAEITRMALENIIVTDSSAFSGGRGLLAGTNTGSITESYATGSITSSVSTAGNQIVGGLVGTNTGTKGAISRSFADVDIQGAGRLGGLVGWNDASGTVSDSFATGNISGYQTVGGLIGLNGSGAGAVERTYATGRVSANSDVGALLSDSSAKSIQDSYYDLTLSGENDTKGGVNSLSEDLRDVAHYSNWPIVAETTPDGSATEVWGIHPSINSGYPFLWWQEKNAFCPNISSGVYQVTTPPELAAVASGGPGSVSSGVDCGAGDKYEQKNFIDLTNFGPWYPIAPNSARAFTGEFNGARYDIRAGKQWGSEFVGLFGYIGSGGLVTRVGLERLNVQDAARVSGDPGMGGLAQRNDGTIRQSYVRGTIDAVATDCCNGPSKVGGLVGINVGTIEYSYAAVDLEGGSFLGGIAGIHGGNDIRDSYATGNVTGWSFLGGVAGSHGAGDGGIDRTYATGKITETGGGFAGAIANGFDLAHRSYFDPTLSGRFDLNGGISRTSAQLRSAGNWMGWGIVARTNPDGTTNEIWGIDATINSGYPFLWWQQDNAFCPRSVTNANVYQVRTAPELAAIGTGGSGDIGTGAVCGRDDDYELTAAIDLANFGPWYPIGPSSTAPFWGSFDGNAHTISNLAINASSSDFQGLFGYTETNASLSEVRLTNVDVKGRDFVGALVGQNRGQVTASSSTGKVEGNNSVGGLVGGTATASSQITRSFSSVTVTGRDGISPDFARVGGLVGHLLDGDLADSYASGSVSGDSQVGGLIGLAKDATVTNSYAYSTVQAQTAGSEGGLVGAVSGTNTFTAAYYDATVTDLADTGKGEPKTTLELRDLATYSGWAMVQSDTPTGPTAQVWGVSTTKNSCYPFLWWQTGLTTPDCSQGTPPPANPAPASGSEDRSSRDSRSTVAVDASTLPSRAAAATPSTQEETVATAGDEGASQLDDPSSPSAEPSDGDIAGAQEATVLPDRAEPNYFWAIALGGLGALLLVVAIVAWLISRARPARLE